MYKIDLNKIIHLKYYIIDSVYLMTEVCYWCRGNIVDGDNDIISPCECSVKAHKTCIKIQLNK